MTMQISREVCSVHGWVGRRRYVDELHVRCEPVGEPCVQCNGNRVEPTGIFMCHRCDGTGIEPAETTKVRVPVTPPRIPGLRQLSRRQRWIARSFVVTVRDNDQRARERLRLGAEVSNAERAAIDSERPKTRDECRGAERPCPWVGCRYHLYLDINPETGSLKLNFPDLEPWELKQSCALDVAESGGHLLEEVGELTNMTRERIRQIEIDCLFKLGKHKGLLR